MLKQIKYFQSVVRLHSFSDAADENFISQSAISQGIQALERELGFPLLIRKNRSFTLTPAGEYFYQKSGPLLAEYETICREARGIAQGNQPSLRLGYLRSYTGRELSHALGAFAKVHPEVAVSIVNGNHEELYEMLRQGQVDLVLSDQRRAFSDAYVNLLLHAAPSYVEVSAYSPLATQKETTPEALKSMPCILVASVRQRETEEAYYKHIVGIQSEILFAENMDEARLMVIGRQGFLLVEGETSSFGSESSLVRIPLKREGKPIWRNYCAFWKKEQGNEYVKPFATCLQGQFGD